MTSMGALLEFAPNRQKSEVEGWRQAAYAAVDQMIEKLDKGNGQVMSTDPWQLTVDMSSMISGNCSRPTAGSATASATTTARTRRV
jgi:hypothetical protein